MAEDKTKDNYPGKGLLAQRYMEHEQRRKTLVDPKRFVGSFLSSSAYRTALQEYFERTEGVDATEGEKVRIFQENPETKVLLLKHAQATPFVYDEAYLRNNGYSGLVEPFRRYVSATELFGKATTTEGKQRADENRRIAHTRFAEVLHDVGVAPTYNLARGMASIMLASQIESETLDRIIQNEIRRFEKMAEALRSQTPGNE